MIKQTKQYLLFIIQIQLLNYGFINQPILSIVAPMLSQNQYLNKDTGEDQYIARCRCLRQVCTKGELFPSYLKMASISLLAFLSYHSLLILMIASSCSSESSIMALARQNWAAWNLRARLSGSAYNFCFQLPVSLFSCFSLSKFQTSWHRWLKRDSNYGFSVQNKALVFMVQTEDLSCAILASQEQTKPKKISPTNLNSSLTFEYLIAVRTFSAYSYFFSLISICPCSSPLTTASSQASGSATLPAVYKNLVSCSSSSQPVKASMALPPWTMQTVGTPFICNACAICPNLSIFILRSLSFPPDQLTLFSSRGVSFLQGPHQSAQKSMSKVQVHPPTMGCQSQTFCNSIIFSMWFWQNSLPFYLVQLIESVGGF